MASVPMVRSAMVAAVVEQLARIGVDPSGPLRNCGLLSQKLGDPYALVPLVQFVRLCEEAAIASGDDAVGLRVGQMMSREHHGPAGLIFGASRDVEQALTRYARLMNAWQDAADVGLVAFGDNASAFVYRISDSGISARRQDAELTISTFCRQLRSVLGRDWQPLAVHFEHPQPANTEPHRKILGGPVFFSEEENRIIIAHDDLRRPISDFDGAIWHFVERHLTDLAEDRSSVASFADQVMARVVERLGQESVDLPSIAETLGTTVRTFQRRLSEEGVTFRALVMAARRQIAERHLEQPRGRVTEVAIVLGYSDVAAFSRAFKRWTGTAPKRYGRGRTET